MTEKVEKLDVVIWSPTPTLRTWLSQAASFTSGSTAALLMIYDDAKVIEKPD
jgi:hypothetical protein